MDQENTKIALRRALAKFKESSPVEQTAVRAFEDHFDALANALQHGVANLNAMAIMNGLVRSVASINAAISSEIRVQLELENNIEIQEAASAAKSSTGASATFLRRDQCSHGGADAEGKALYKEFLTELHKMGEILMDMPRGSFAKLDGSMLWVSPLKNTPGADLFIYSCGGEVPEMDGNGTFPLAYCDELGVGVEVVELTTAIRNWLNNQVFGSMAPDYLLDQIASFADCCRYSVAEA